MKSKVILFILWSMFSFRLSAQSSADSLLASFRFVMFPEGGNLVSGIPSRLAFKATDGRGNPVFVEETLFQDGEPLNEIKSVHDGMGAFLFTPLPDRQYRMELKNGRSYPLPDIHSEGMVLRLSKQDKKRLDFIVSQSDGLPDQEICVVGKMRGMVCCMAKGVLKDNLKVSIPLDNFLYQGIAEFTLFNSSMQPIAERLVYVHPENKLHITVESEKSSFRTLDPSPQIKLFSSSCIKLKSRIFAPLFLNSKCYAVPTTYLP